MMPAARSWYSLSSVRGIVGRRRYRVVLVLTAVGYWIIYALSDGILQYYQVGFDLASVFKGVGVPTVDFGLYYAGVEWYPNGHLEVNLFLGPTLFSVLFSLLFGINMAVLAYLMSTRFRNGRMGLAGFLGMIPAFFSSGMPCYSAPLGTILLSALVPSAALATFSFAYAALTNVVIATAMFISILYVSRKVARLPCKARPWSNQGLNQSRLTEDPPSSGPPRLTRE